MFRYTKNGTRISYMLSDSDCAACGGPMGNMSDICLNCGKSPPIWPAIILAVIFAGFILSPYIFIILLNK